MKEIKGVINECDVDRKRIVKRYDFSDTAEAYEKAIKSKGLYYCLHELSQRDDSVLLYKTDLCLLLDNIKNLSMEELDKEVEKLDDEDLWNFEHHLIDRVVYD